MLCPAQRRIAFVGFQVFLLGGERKEVVTSVGDQGDQGKTRPAPEHRRGTETSAEDLVGPPEW